MASFSPFLLFEIVDLTVLGVRFTAAVVAGYSRLLI